MFFADNVCKKTPLNDKSDRTKSEGFSPDIVSEWRPPFFSKTTFRCASKVNFESNCTPTYRKLSADFIKFPLKVTFSYNSSLVEK